MNQKLYGRRAINGKLTMKRIDYIDRMKGFAIFLVVMGHLSFSGISTVMSPWISSFHMSLFMFLSGLVACSGITPPLLEQGEVPA